LKFSPVLNQNTGVKITVAGKTILIQSIFSWKNATNLEIYLVLR